MSLNRITGRSSAGLTPASIFARFGELGVRSPATRRSIWSANARLARVLRVGGLFWCTASFSACSARWRSNFVDAIAKLRLNSKVATLPLIHRRNRPSYTRDHTLESWLIVCTQGTASKAGRIWTGLSRFETHPCGFALDAAIAPLPPARFSRHRSPPHPPLAHFLYNR